MPRLNNIEAGHVRMWKIEIHIRQVCAAYKCPIKFDSVASDGIPGFARVFDINEQNTKRHTAV